MYLFPGFAIFAKLLRSIIYYVYLAVKPLKPNTFLFACLLSLLLAFSSLTNAGHWHDASGLDIDCVACFHDAGSEAAVNLSDNTSFPFYLSHQPIADGGVFVPTFFAAFSARAPPVFS
jgi:hypothetical protein